MWYAELILLRSVHTQSTHATHILRQSMYQHGFLRKLFAIDGGFWKHPSGKAYKLLLVESTTGNHENCCVAWAIVDGETTENIDWVIARLKSADVDLNCKDVATISDEGKAILKAINNSLALSFHMACAKHWIGNHSGCKLIDELIWHSRRHCWHIVSINGSFLASLVFFSST